MGLRAAALGICAILGSLVVAAGASAQGVPAPPGSGPPGVLPSTPPAWFEEGAALIRQANPAMSCATAPGATSVVDSDCNLKGTSFAGPYGVLDYGSCGTTNDVTPQGIVTLYHCVFSYALPNPPDPWIKCSGGAGPWTGDVAFNITAPFATLGQCLQAIRAGSPTGNSGPGSQPQRNPATPASKFTVDGPQSTLTSLNVGNVMPGATVVLSCLGAKCPFEAKRTTKARNGVVNALAMLGKKPAKRRFRAGQSLELRITAPGYLGKVIRYKIRRGKQPKVTKLCLPPGASKPKASC